MDLRSQTGGKISRLFLSEYSYYRSLLSVSRSNQITAVKKAKRGTTVGWEDCQSSNEKTKSTII